MDIIENQKSETLITFALQEHLYSTQAAEIVAKSFKHLAEQFCADPTLLISKSTVFSQNDIQSAIDLGRGKMNIRSADGSC